MMVICDLWKSKIILNLAAASAWVIIIMHIRDDELAKGNRDSIFNYFLIGKREPYSGFVEF
jgi:hypothetical protein